MTNERQQTLIGRYIEDRANKSGQNYRDIAITAGFGSADIIYRFIRGEAHVPLDAVPQLAEALECNGAELMLLAIEQLFQPSLFQKVRESYDFVVPTDFEREWLDVLRSVFHGTVPELSVSYKSKFSKLLTALK